VAIVAGDLSGDASGRALALELQRLRPDVQLWGAGGPRMRDVGVELAADLSSASAIGIAESLKLAPRLLGASRRLRRLLLERSPDVFVPIDFGAFNVGLGRFAREHGIPTIYYFPPGSWRRTKRDQSSLIAAADKIITPFPWSAELLSEAGADAVFPGHPMLDWVAPARSRPEFVKELDLREGARLIGLLPGSRAHEIASLLPVLVEASVKISEQMPEKIAYLIPVGSERAARGVFQTALRLIPEKWRRHTDPDDAGGDTLLAQYRVVVDGTYDVMAHSELLVTCSGTATLEAMVLGTPMIIVYRGSKLMKLEYLFRKGILERFFGMPNIIAGRKICPELLEDQASPEVIAKLAVEFLEKPEELERMRSELQSAKAALGEPGGTARAAGLVLEAAGLLSSA